MPTDDQEELLATWYGRLDPGPLDVAESEQDRARYVDLDGWRAPDGQVRGLRGPAVVEKILDTIRLTARQPAPGSTHLFAGFPGTGKTTELGRLTRELGAPGRSPGFSVLRVSARRYHRLDRALSIEEMTVLLMAGIGEAALETLDEAALPRLQKAQSVWDSVHARIKKVLGDSAVTFKLGIADIKPALFGGGTSLRDQLRAALGEKADEKLRELLHGLVLEIATAIHPRQLVVMVDDLEKYTVSTPNVAEVYQAMADLFFHNAALFKLPLCHTIYTVPPYLAFLNQGIEGVFDDLLHLLPSVKVHGRPPERHPYPPGIDALTRIISTRVDLDLLFGTDREACMEQLVIASGGHIRDLASIMKRVVRIALRETLPLGLHDVRNAIIQHGAARTLLKDDLDILLEVSKHGDLGRVETQRLGACAGAMDQQLILCYWNGEFWYDAHPIIAGKVEKARENLSQDEDR